MPATTTSPTRRAGETRLALLRAAERLFAEQGVDRVSMREIAAAAGQANHSAALYHFKDKRDLLDALLSRHSAPMSAAWLVALEHLRAESRDDLRELCGLMVRTVAAKLDDADGGRDYLRIVAELVTSRSFPIAMMDATRAPGIVALSARMMECIGGIPEGLVALRMMRATAVLFCSIADYLALEDSGGAPPRDLFVKDLIASMVSVIAAPGNP